MSHFLIRAGKGALLLLVLSLAGLAAAVALRHDRTFDAPYPDVRASDDPAVIARGRYLAYGPAHCVDCHGDPERAHDRAPDEEIPFTGGATFELPVGTFYVPNITPDRDTGIGRYRDDELARALRHGVHPEGRAMLPFMPFADMSDEDLTAVISYLRSRPPVRHAVPAHDVNVLGLAIRALVLEPTGPSKPVRAAAPVGPTAVRGEYLANDVANCAGCHTQRDLRTGAFTGPRFAGGFEAVSHDDPSVTLVTPNLTRHPEGRLAAWTEDDFVARFRGGEHSPLSPMPWRSFGTMSDDDLRALYRYLRSVRPAATPEL